MRYNEGFAKSAAFGLVVLVCASGAAGASVFDPAMRNRITAAR